MTYPEHEKLKSVQEKSQAIGEFMEWLRYTKKYTIAKWYKSQWDADDEEETDRLMPEFPSIEKLLAEYYGIDLNKIEEEKRAMLDEIRRHNKDE